MKNLLREHKTTISVFIFGLLFIVLFLWIKGYFPTMDEAKARLISSAVIGWGALFGIIVAAERNRVLGQQVDNERLTEAIGLLAKTDSKGIPLIEARVGALYSLEALANTHPKDYGAQVIKTIAAYICENAQKTARDMPGKPDERKAASPLGKDVQTAFAVLKRLYDKYAHNLIEQGKLRRFTHMSLYKLVNFIDDTDFSYADFRRLDLVDVEWVERPMLRRAKFQGALLYNAQLKGAFLWLAELQEANLSGAELQGADLMGAELQKTDLQDAHLQGANLKKVQLQETNLTGAYLDYSRWHGAEIEGDNRDLWQPQSAQIFCDDGFPPLGYGHKPTQQLNPDDTKHNWQKGWAGVLDEIPSPIRHNVVTLLFLTQKSHSLQGLGKAIQALKDYKILREKLHERLQKWLDEEIS